MQAGRTDCFEHVHRRALTCQIHVLESPDVYLHLSDLLLGLGQTPRLPRAAAP